MTRTATALALTLSIAAAAAFGQGPEAGRTRQPFTGDLTAGRIRAAIDDAVAYVRSCQRADGSIAGDEGQTVLAALAMLAAGGDPASDSQLSKALDWLATREPNNTYIRAIRANVWEYALRKVPDDKKLRDLLEKDYKWLIEAMNAEGWRYTKGALDWDNSCTQYGVLGVWAAARAGFEPGDDFWKRCSAHFRKFQNADGGWGYTPGAGSTANMATAGLASLFLVFDMYHGRSYYSAANPRTFTEGDSAAVLAAIDRGMTWLGRAGGTADGYYLYGIERTGVASGLKRIGGQDWFREGATAVLRNQQPNGSIPQGSYGGPVVNTCFASMFLVFGGAPVALNKLQYGPGQDWNLNPRDLANLAKDLWGAYERPLNWHTVSVDANASEFEAPILFISGSKAAAFTEKQFLQLRQYVQRGGTILAEPSDHSKAFAESMVELLRQMFPPNVYPNVRLAELPEDHDLYTVLPQTWKNRPRLRGACDGSRTFFLLSDDYLSAAWQSNDTASDAFKLAMNLLFYATDMASLEGKYATIVPAGAPAKPRTSAATVARVRFTSSSGPADWDAAAMAWTLYAPYVRHVTGCELQERQPVTLGKDDLAGIALLHITGRGEFKMAPAEREALVKYVRAGGTVLVDAYAGAPAFAAAARRELEAVFGKLEPLADDTNLSAGRFVGGEDLTGAVGFTLPARKLLRGRGVEPRGQKLLAAMSGKRPAVIFSEFDLCASMAGIANYRSLGYKPDSARKIVGNVLAYVMAD